MGRSCKETAKDLAACCKMNYGNVTVKECATGDAYLKAEDECTAMRAAYYHCKRQQMDMRSRIRGVRGFAGVGDNDGRPTGGK